MPTISMELDGGLYNLDLVVDVAARQVADVLRADRNHSQDAWWGVYRRVIPAIYTAAGRWGPDPAVLHAAAAAQLQYWHWHSDPHWLEQQETDHVVPDQLLTALHSGLDAKLPSVPTPTGDLEGLLGRMRGAGYTLAVFGVGTAAFADARLAGVAALVARAVRLDERPLPWEAEGDTGYLADLRGGDGAGWHIGCAHLASSIHALALGVPGIEIHHWIAQEEAFPTPHQYGRDFPGHWTCGGLAAAVDVILREGGSNAGTS